MPRTQLADADRVAPPPFHRQRQKSTLLLVALVVTIAATIVAGMLLTVPTHSTGNAIALDDGRTLVLLNPALDGRIPVGSMVKLQLVGLPQDTEIPLTRIEGRLDGAEATARFDLPPAALRTLPGPWLAAVADGPAAGPLPGSAGVAVADVGRRPLIAVFLGQGLEA